MTTTTFSHKCFLLLIISSAIIFTSSSAAPTYCNKTRPTEESCYDEPYVATCGFYKKNCPLGTCGSYAGSACQACSNPDVLYYEKRDCKPAEVVNTCSPDLCDIESNPSAYSPNDYSPVCGFTQNATSAKSGKTFGNVCNLCAQNYTYYQDNGACPADKTTCRANSRNQTCATQNLTSVCAFFTNRVGEETFTTVSSGCNACKDASVQYHLPSACGPVEGGKTYCLPTSSKACTKIYDPVCGFYTAKDGSVAHKIMSNACTACSQTNVIYHTAGPCVFQCDRNPWQVTECSGSVNPVCGSYVENGVKKSLSLRNSCLACYGISQTIDNYTEGLCKGDEGILCSNVGGAYAEPGAAVVCGATKAGCKNSTCQTSFLTPQDACSNGGALLIKNGYCPGDEGIPCKGYRQQGRLLEQGRLLQGDFDDSSVCAYTKKGCTSSSCRRAYGDPYSACQNKSVLFFKPGSC